MARARLLMLSLALALPVFALSAASASAKISFEWFVGGSLLKAGEQRKSHINTDGKTFDFHSRLLGINVLLLSTKVTTVSGTTLGGRPGTGDETLAFENVTVAPPLQRCVVETGLVAKPEAGRVETELLKGEIVESQGGGIALLYGPQKAGGPFFTMLFLNKGAEECAANRALGEVKGNILGEVLPETVGQSVLNIVTPGVQKNFLLASGGSEESAGLTFGAEAATLKGLFLYLLLPAESLEAL